MGARRGAAVQGMGGVGKTVLAAAVVHDPEIRAAFSDGTVWLTLGQTPDVLTLQRRLLAWVAPDKEPPTEVQVGRDVLDTALKSRRWLIVLDDVWRQSDLRAFEVADTPSRLLLTTRDEGVVRSSGAVPHVVDEFSEPAAREFLAKAVGVAERDLPPATADVIRECGRLPLALALAGASLANGPKDESLWHDVLEALAEADHDRLSHEFDYPYPHVLAAIQASVDFLPPEDRTAYLQLAIFPEDAPIPLAPLGKLWGTTGLELRNRVQLFVDRALARRQEGGSILLHDLQRDFVRRRCPDVSAIHRRLLQGYRPDAAVPWADLRDDGYLYRHLPQHLAEGDRLDELQALLLDARWLARRLQVVGPGGLCESYERLGGDSVLTAVVGALRLSANVHEKDPGQMASQLAGRLGATTDPDIRELIVEAAADTELPCLMPRTASLAFPGGALRQTLVGHQDQVSGVAITVDGRVISSSHDRTLKVWNLATGACVATLVGHEDTVNAVAVTTDGRAVSASDDKTLKVWDLTSGACTATLVGHQDTVRAVAVTADGRAISASDDKTLKVWDLASGACTATLTGHEGKVWTLALTADGRAVSASFDVVLDEPPNHFIGTLKVWDLASGACTATLSNLKGWILAVAVTDDGQVVSADMGGTLKIWNIASGACARTLSGHEGPVHALAVRDGLAVSADEGTLRVWDVAEGTCKTVVSCFGERVNAVALTADGCAVSGLSDGTLKLWDLSHKAPGALPEGHRGWVEAVAVTVDGRAVSASDDRTLKVWDVKSGACTATLTGHKEGVTAVAVTADGRAVSASYDETLKVWDLASGACTATLVGHENTVNAVAVTADGRAVSASDDKTLKVWDLASGVCVATLVGHQNEVTVVALAGEGLGVSASDDKTLKVWDLGSGTCITTLIGHRDPINAVAVTADGRAVSASRDETLKVWDLTSGACTATLVGHQDTVRAVAVTADGRAVSASDDETLKVWDLASETCTATLVGHHDTVSAVAVMAGGRAVSASHDKTLKVWDLASGRCLASFYADAKVMVIACTDEGLIIAGDAGGAVHFLELLEEGSPCLMQSII